MKKRRLGKGLASLISKPEEKDGEAAQDGARAPGEGRPVEIELSRVELNPEQPRQVMDEEALEGLADSIRNAGVLQPVVVRPQGDMFELIMGERRLRAAHKVGLETIPAFIREVTDDQMLELALIENVQREDLNAIEKGRAVERMVQELDLTQEEVGNKLGLSRSTVTNFIRLLDLPEEVQQMVSRGTLTAGHARAVLTLEGAEQRVALAKKIVRKGLSVREAEKLAARGVRPPTTTKSEPSPQVKRLQRELQESLGTRVEIRSRGQKGRILIHFSDNDQFERLFDLMTEGRVIGESAA